MNEELAARHLCAFKVGYGAKLFDRRVECLRWYDTFSIIAASHGGDVKLWRFARGTADNIVVGKGKGGGIMDMQICRDVVYTVGHDGCVKSTDIGLGLVRGSFSTTSLGSTTRPGFECDHWFTAVDCSSESSVLVGCNQGTLYHFSHGNLELQSTTKLHKSKITSVQRNPRNSNLIATASTDKRVQVFDIRRLNKAVLGFSHKAAVNCALFSSDGTRLLTTCQDSTVTVHEVHNLNAEAVDFVQRPGEWIQIHTNTEHFLDALFT
jgi:WD40 repeat protein